MDSGVGVLDILSAQEARKAKLFPPPSALSPNQLLAILDKLFIAEHLFFDSFSLHQTLLSCYYLHDVANIDDPALRIYSQVLLRRVLLLRERIITSTLGDEEEFYPWLFHFQAPLLRTNPDRARAPPFRDPAALTFSSSLFLFCA